MPIKELNVERTDGDNKINRADAHKIGSMTNIEIIRKLIGPIHPIGKSEVDRERLENLHALGELIIWLLHDIDRIRLSNKDAYEHSVIKAVTEADLLINSIIELYTPHANKDT